jgi:hypothetical protein
MYPQLFDKYPPFHAETTTFTSTVSIQAIAQQYGDSRFQIIPLATALADPFFNRCNNYMLTR